MTNKASKRILSVTINRMIDTDPDTSWMGEYSNSGTSEFSIDRAHSLECVVNGGSETAGGDDTDQDISDMCGCGESGDMERGQYRYFNPSSNYVDASDNLVDGNTPEDVTKYVRQDYERMESLNRQNWCFYGIAAEAQVQTNGMSTIQTIRSGGLWGIESDSDRDYFQMVETEELDQLKTELHAIGFTKRAISAAFRNVEHKDE